MDYNRTNSDDIKTMCIEAIKAIGDNANSDDIKTMYNEEIKAVGDNANSDDLKTMCNEDTKMPMFQKKNLDSLEALAFDSMVVATQNSDSDKDNQSNNINLSENHKKEEMEKTLQDNVVKNVKPVKTLPPGTIINSTYQIVRKIAQGGMGVVYEGIDLNIQRRVAIKMILATFGESQYQTVLQRFVNEINATAQLSYRNIVHIYSSGLYQNKPYLVMEYIEGQSINQYVAKNCLSDWKKIAELIYKVAKGLAYIHQHNFLHRDIKPTNILVTNEGEPILIDFGVVKDKNLTVEFTRQGKLLGTLQYMPIEQAQGNNKEVDCRSDIYSLGIVLYELLTQQPAYSGTNYTIFQKILHEEPVLPRKINPNIPVELQRITLHAIAKDKNDRYQNASIFAQALGNYVYPQEIEAPIEEKKVQWHFVSNWNVKKKRQYLKKIDTLQKRKRRAVHVDKKESFSKKVIWSLILFISILSLIVFSYFHLYKPGNEKLLETNQTSRIEDTYNTYIKENPKEIHNFRYKCTRKNQQSGFEYDEYDYKFIPEMPFIYVSHSHGDYLLAKQDCKQSTWLRVMNTAPWEGELLQTKRSLYCDYHNILPKIAQNDVQYKDNQNAIAPNKPVIWIDLYDCQEFCHRIHLTLMTQSQWNHAKELEPFKNMTESQNYRYHYGDFNPNKKLITKDVAKPYEADMITTFRCAYLIDEKQNQHKNLKQNSNIAPILYKKNIHDKKDIPGFAYLGMKRFSLEKEAKSIPQYMHIQSHIIFSLFSKKQENGEALNFLMSVMPCCYRNWDYIMNTREQHSTYKDQFVYVTLKECNDFCRKANLSLPTDIQWKYTCTEETEQSFLSNQSGIYVFESEVVFCTRKDKVYLGIKKKTYENQQEVTIEPISDYEESQTSSLRFVYNLP